MVLKWDIKINKQRVSVDEKLCKLFELHRTVGSVQRPYKLSVYENQQQHQSPENSRFSGIRGKTLLREKHNIQLKGDKTNP